MNYQQLQKRFVHIQQQLTAMSDAFPWEHKDTYLSWLAQSYEYVRYSTRILSLTAGHFAPEKTLHSNRFIQHAAEEKGHDKLLVHDAKALGVDLTKVPVLAEAEAFHKSLYYWIYQGKPEAILGWVLCLEGFAVENGPKIYNRLQKAHGAKASTFLKVHSEEDQEHIAKAFETLQSFSDQDLATVAHGLDLYANLYMNMYAAVSGKKQTQYILNQAA